MDKKMVPEVRFKGFTDDWEQLPLSKISNSFSYGLNVSSKKYDGKNKYIRITDIDDNSHKLVKKNLTSPNTNLEDISDYQLKENDLLFARTGASVGKSYLYDNADGKAFFAGFLIRMEINGEFDKNFVFQNTLTDKYQQFVKITSQRSGQPGINAKEYASFKIIIPKSFNEQRLIGKLYFHLDNLITLQQRQLDLYKKLKKGLLQKLFPKDGERVPEVRFANFHDDWEQRKSNEIFSPISKKGYPELPVLSVTQDQGVVKRKDLKIDIKYDKTTLKNYKLVSNGNFIISLRSFQGGFELSRIQGIVSPAYTVFKFKNPHEYNFEFWRSWFKTFKFIQSLKTITFGIRDGKSISFSEFKSLKNNFPVNVKEQEQIGHLLEKVNNTIDLQKDEINKSKALKKYLLQKLFI